ncbi:MAG: hypothetical protein WCC97_14420 [Candidatus Acidiferrales bacterium]
MSSKPIRRFPRWDLDKLTPADRHELLMDACKREVLRLRALTAFKNANVLPIIANLFDVLFILERERKRK